MRWRRVRVRALMAAVVVVALLLWGAMMAWRSIDYFGRARFYAAREAGWRESAARGRLPPEFYVECEAYFAGLSAKYRQAAWRPWSPVAPDPHAPGYDRWVEQERRAKSAASEPLPPDSR
ncbi:MAG: hypothetical protein AB7I30_22140 [Isosphaeraceae bacterium]